MQDALALASKDGLDLIVVAAEAKPPVCKIMDYGHYKYEKEKQQKLAKKGSRSTVMKELKLSPKISEHDYQVRYRAAVKFLNKGNKVKLTVNFRGREMRHTDLGEKLLNRMMDELKEIAVPENAISISGRSMTVFLVHK